uniref:Uncharacterized protein n=1 Tax=Tanacetum cinerariifolium TaxID=118510 RepID=A0A699L7T4_TANCI|nr:hypothetical protein [Tanacetum cinerariifolium]
MYSEMLDCGNKKGRERNLQYWGHTWVEANACLLLVCRSIQLPATEGIVKVPESQLTTTFRHSELSYMIKDPNGKVLTMDDFLKLPVWNGTIVSKGDPIPNDQCPSLRTSPPLEAGKLIPEKSLAQRIAPNLVDEIITSIPKDTTENADIRPKMANAEREVVQLSENTRIPIPSVTIIQPSAHAEHDDTQENVEFSDGEFFCVIVLRFVPEWGLRDDLRVFSFKARKELVSHLATPVEEEFLSGLSNVEVVRHAY